MVLGEVGPQHHMYRSTHQYSVPVNTYLGDYRSVPLSKVESIQEV